MSPGLNGILAQSRAHIPGLATKWRIYIEEVFGSPYVRIDNIEFRESIGGENLLPNISGPDSRLIYSSQVDDGFRNAWRAIEYRYYGLWQNAGDLDPEGPGKGFIGWEFASPVTLSEIVILTDNRGRSDLISSIPKIIRLEYYDGSEWVTYFRHTFTTNTPEDTRVVNINNANEVFI